MILLYIFPPVFLHETSLVIFFIELWLAFFSKGGITGPNRKRKRNHKSTKPFEMKLKLTKKQRAAAARAQYEQQYGPTLPSAPPPILGHHSNNNHHHSSSPFSPSPNKTLPLSLPAPEKLLHYCDNILGDRENLRNFSNIFS